MQQALKNLNIIGLTLKAVDTDITSPTIVSATIKAILQVATKRIDASIAELQAAHDKRVTELLKANSMLVERCRVAEMDSQMYKSAFSMELRRNIKSFDALLPLQQARPDIIATCINDIRGLLEDSEGYPSFKGSDADHNVYQNAMGILMAELGITDQKEPE